MIPSKVGSSVRLGVLLLAAAACGDSSVCLSVPCPLSFAIHLMVASAATNGAVSNATVDIAGAEADTVSCNSGCYISGPAGTYHLTVSAPGYESAQRAVVILPTTEKCSCSAVQSQDVSISLTPAA